MSHGVRVSGWIPMSLGEGGSAIVVGADGRSLRKNGRPLVNLLEVREEDAEITRWRRAHDESSDGWAYEPIVIAERTDFPNCPICGSGENLTAEHVPPERLGGRVLTVTCRECNNAFGSKYEDDLLKTAEDRFTLAVRGAGLRGERRIADVVLRSDGAGRLLLSTWNGAWPAWFDPAFAGVGHEFQLEAPCRCRAYVAMVKNAYLAACVLAPDAVTSSRWPVAERLRQQVLMWRNSSEQHLVMSARFNRLHVRYDAPVLDEPSVSLCLATNRTTGDRREVLRMGWQLVIDWPIDAARVEIGTQL